MPLLRLCEGVLVWKMVATLFDNQWTELPTVRILLYFPGKLFPCPLYGNKCGNFKIVKWPLKSTLTVLHVHCTCTHMHSTWSSKCSRTVPEIQWYGYKIRKNIAWIHKTQTGGWHLWVKIGSLSNIARNLGALQHPKHPLVYSLKSLWDPCQMKVKLCKCSITLQVKAYDKNIFSSWSALNIMINWRIKNILFWTTKSSQIFTKIYI